MADELVANDDEATTSSGTPVTVDVLANDTLDGAPVTLGDLAGPPTILSQPEFGEAVVEADGRITYTPPPGFSGQVEFQYRIRTAASRFFITGGMGIGPSPLHEVAAFDDLGIPVPGFQVRWQGQPVNPGLITGAGVYTASATPEGTYLLFGHFLHLPDSSEGCPDWVASVIEIDATGGIVRRNDLGSDGVCAYSGILGAGGLIVGDKVFCSVGTYDSGYDGWPPGTYVIEMNRDLQITGVYPINGGLGDGDPMFFSQKCITDRGRIFMSGISGRMLIYDTTDHSIVYDDDRLATNGPDGYTGDGVIAVGDEFVAGGNLEGTGEILRWDDSGGFIGASATGLGPLEPYSENSVYRDGKLYMLHLNISTSEFVVARIDVGSWEADMDYSYNVSQPIVRYDIGINVDDQGRVYVTEEGEFGDRISRIGADGGRDESFNPSVSEVARVHTPFVGS